MLTPLRKMLIVVNLLSGGLAAAEAQEVVTFLKVRPLPADVTPRVQLSACGGWSGFYGPIDYRSAETTTRRRVEVHHFDVQMPMFLGWSPTKPFDNTIAKNFQYTLRAFPNHPVTLAVMEQIGRRLGSENIPGSDFPLECWYLRALQTVPDDPMVRAQYGIYLAFRGRNEEARRNLDIGDRGLCWLRAMQYQIGLANQKTGAFAMAQKNAMRAERMGLALPQLKKSLVDAGQWRADISLPEGPTLDCDLSDPATAESGANATAETASDAASGDTKK